MYKFYQIIAVVVTLFCSSAYGSDSMKQFQYNLEKTTHNSKASSTVAIARGDSVFQTSSKSVADNTQYSVGYKFIELTDEARQDPYDKDHKRKLKVTLYYPSQEDKKVESYGAEETTFWSRELTDLLKEGEIKQEEFDSIESDFNRLVSFKSYGATPVKGNFPTIIFEHGYGVTAGSYQYLILDLVSHGYVVISPAHPYIADTVMFSDGSKSFLKAERNAELFDTAFQDAEFLLSKIDDIAKQVESADISKLGIIGHSLGATTSIKLARKSPLIKAGISLDPLINHITYEYDDDKRIESKVDDKISLDNGSNLDKPFLYVFAEKYMCDPSTLTLSKNNYKAVIKGTEHNSFADHAVLNFQRERLEFGSW